MRSVAQAWTVVKGREAAAAAWRRPKGASPEQDGSIAAQQVRVGDAQLSDS